MSAVIMQACFFLPKKHFRSTTILKRTEYHIQICIRGYIQYQTLKTFTIFYCVVYCLINIRNFKI